MDPGKVLKIVAAVLAMILSGPSRDFARARVAEEWGISPDEVRSII